jgi:poly-gamma-glutamate capsule biosynthesis protein CapA/YwtB (metallophosphatase superfamily)
MTRLLVAVALLAGLTACGTASPPAATSSSATPSSVPPAASPSPSTSVDPDITLAFAGDVHFTDRTATLLTDPAHAFGPITPLLSDADLTMVNFESAVTNRGTPQLKQFHFRAPPVSFDAVRGAGIDVVTFANNHVLDYGQVGLADTLSAAKTAGFPYVGIGRTADEAWRPWVTTIKNKRIAIIGVSQVDELASAWVATDARPGEAHAIDLSHTLAAIRAARQQADVVIVFMHWGTEGNPCPNAAQKALAPKMAAAGADIIVGAHAHTLQGNGWLGKTFVAYGMGNFLWWLPSYSTETGVLKLTLHPSAPLTARFYPAVVSDTGQPVPASGADATRISTRYASLRTCAGLAASPS